MKTVLYFISIFICTGIFAQNTYFIATDGDDVTGDGTIGNPWGSWQKGALEATPGDTVYIRGGTYYPTTRIRSHISGAMVIDPDAGYGVSGKRDSIIHYWNYPGETPILDCSQMDNNTSNFNQGIKVNRIEHVSFRGLTIRKVLQNKDGSAPEAYGISASRVRYLTFDRVTVHDIGGRGFYIQGGAYLSWKEDGGTEATPYWPDMYDTTRFINCDVYNICDTIDYSGAGQPGNSGDAWKTMHYRGNHLIWEGCRMWNYTDDATDPSLINGATLRINNCWAMPGTAYDGLNLPSHITGNDTVYGVEQNGIKLSKVERDLNYHTGIVTNCIAMFGRTGGGFSIIDMNPYRGNHVFYNNTSYYFRWCFNGTGVSTVDHPRTEIYINNLAWGATGTNAIGDPSYISLSSTSGEPETVYPESNNNWDAYAGSIGFRLTDTVTVSAEDFLYRLDSVKMVEMFVADRKIDGSLPPNPLTIDPSSDLIDAGKDIGLPYSGKAPDIGAVEYGTVSVELTTPADSSTYSQGNSVPLKANAFDAEGTIDRVLFYTKNKEKKIGEGTLAGENQWKFDWETDTIGFFDLRAVAINHSGDSATSTRVNVYIYPTIGPGDEKNNCELRYFQDNQSVRLLLNEPLPVSTDLYIVSVDGIINKIIKLNKTELYRDINISDFDPGLYIFKFAKEEISNMCSDTIKFVKY